MAYTTINKPTDYFNTITYTGNATSNTNRTVGGFEPDWVWVKLRSSTDNHYLMDKVRGLDYNLETNNGDAQARDYLISSSSGFNGWISSNSGEVNANNGTYVAWNWKANGAGSTNNDGNRTSTVSVNTTAGFSIVRYVGNNSNNQTIGHGLGVAPKMIFIKRLGNIVAGTADWIVYNKTITAAKHLHLNTTAEAVSDNGMFNGVEPTASVFNIHANDDVNKANDQFIAYCFAEKTGYSKIGSYVGNGNNNGSFVYTGFKPAFTIIKNATTAGYDWVMDDVKRSSFNEMNNTLFANENYVEYTGGAYGIDYLSNGFKIRDDHDNYNKAGDTYIYMAFAEAPLVGSNNVPCTAR